MPAVRRRSVFVFGITLLVATLVAAVSATEAKTGGTETASVSFVRGLGIYLVSVDGHRVTRVLRGSRSESYYEPAWSADGRELAVTASQGTNTNCISVIKQSKPLNAACGGLVGEPSWAPDGRRFVFMHQYSEFGGELNIWRWGSKTTTVVTGSGFGSDVLDSSPTWSPNGSEIAFARGREAKRLYVIRPDGTGTKRVTTSTADDPSWSPDSRRLVFDDGRRIAVIDVNGRNFRYLTQPKTRDLDPAWSPDGRWIAFARYRSNRSQATDLWLMNTSGESLRLLARNAYQPAWKRG